VEEAQEKIMKRSASALWQGGFKDGRGHLSTASGALHDAPYPFRARFESIAKQAKQAKQGCPVSKLLNATISLDARLEN